MSQITIAAAVLADRLTELEVQDEQLAVLIGDLAGSLGAVMDMSEKVDYAVSVVRREFEMGNNASAYEGLALIKGVTSDLVADQDKIEAAMGLSIDDDGRKLVLDLIQALGLARR
jgi:hypothetical protein